ncbi:MAG: DNA translocase FtsK [Tannerella sp.]|jgi:S-DNA-T family DNA segregation ATPase FtsK/SpoIIIE|nr:DNA translocase FtsK [Tannerella sp.]
MANKTTKKQAAAGSGNWWDSFRGFATSERMRFLTGLLISFFAIYLSIAMVSFFFTGGADQSAIDHLSVKELLTGPGKVNNWAGVKGAYLADLMMNRWFGISSFFLLFFIGATGLKMMRIGRFSLLKQFLTCGALLIWSSIFLSFVFMKGYDSSFLYLGGRHGLYMSEALANNIGKPGLALLLLVSFLIIAIFLSKHTIPFLQHVFSFSWLKKNGNNKKINDNKQNWWKSKKDDADSQKAADEEKEDSLPIASVNEPDNTIKPNKTPKPGLIDQVKTTISNENHGEVTFSVDVPIGDDELPDDSSLGKYDPRLDLSNYRFPPVDLLTTYNQQENPVNMDEQTDNQMRIKQTLETFGIEIKSIKATVGPTVTLYEVVPADGVRIAKIRNLEDDIALKLSALGIRIIAPMPGKGTIGIEVPNKEPQIVSMHSIITSRKFLESKFDLPVALGRTITNEIFMFDLSKAPHLLIGGATGEGKSVGLNAIITSLLYKKHPAELKFVLVDVKMVEFSIYDDIERHYLAKLPGEEKAIITDYTKVVYTLNSLCEEMENRYELLTKANVRNIKDYNEKFISRQVKSEDGHQFMPFIVLIIDEFADLIMTAGKDIEMPIARIAQKARAVGIHMIIATQRPSTNIITGTIKANFPTRIAFRVITMIDSRTILDTPGANQLIGRGDLLYYKGSDMIRVQCAFIDGPEVEQINRFIGEQPGYRTAYLLPEYVPDGDSEKMNGNFELTDRDPMFEEAARLIVLNQQGSTSLIQRKLAIGYNRAGRLMDQLEAAGIVGPADGSKARQILILDERILEQKLAAIR